jgi:hypothetical protein
MDTRAKQIQEGMRDAMGYVDVQVKVPWDSEKVLSCSFRKLKVREAHEVLYDCLLPGIKCLRGAFEAFSGEGTEAGPMAIVDSIAELPNAVSGDKFWAMAETLLIGATVDRNEISSLDSFGANDLFTMYLLVFHAIKVNFPFSKKVTQGLAEKFRTTTENKASDSDKS